MLTDPWPNRAVTGLSFKSSMNGMHGASRKGASIRMPGELTLWQSSHVLGRVKIPSENNNLTYAGELA